MIYKEIEDILFLNFSPHPQLYLRGWIQHIFSSELPDQIVHFEAISWLKYKFLWPNQFLTSKHPDPYVYLFYSNLNIDIMNILSLFTLFLFYSSTLLPFYPSTLCMAPPRHSHIYREDKAFRPHAWSSGSHARIILWMSRVNLSSCRQEVLLPECLINIQNLTIGINSLYAQFMGPIWLYGWKHNSVCGIG